MSSGSKSQKRMLVLFSVAIMLCRATGMYDFVIFPITSDIYGAFPGQTGLVNYIISGSQLLLLLMALVVPFLSRRFSKWSLLVIGSVFFAVGSIFGVAFEDPLWMAFTRTLVGIGVGITAIVSVTVVADVIRDKDRQVKMTSVYNASANASAMLFSLGTGLLAAGGWKRPFLLYWMAVPTLLAVIFFVPRDKRPAPAKAADAPKKKVGLGALGAEFWVLAISMAVFCMLRTIVSYYMSSYVSENGLGGSGVAALAASLAQLFAFCGAMSCTVLYSRLRRWIMPLACGVATFAYLLWNTVASVPTVFLVFGLICGISGLFMAYSYAHTLVIVPQEGTDQAIGILSALTGAACFVPTYFITGLMDVLHTSRVTDVLWVPTVIGAVLTVGAVIFTAHLVRKGRPMVLTETFQ